MTSPLPALDYRSTSTRCYTAEQMQAYRADLIALVQAVHKAKGRYHSQIAMCDLYDACGLPNQRPEK